MSDSIEQIAANLYQAWRGGLADWNRLTPENKQRWRRAASYVVVNHEHRQQNIIGPLQELQRAGLLGSRWRAVNHKSVI